MSWYLIHQLLGAENMAIATRVLLGTTGIHTPIASPARIRARVRWQARIAEAWDAGGFMVIK